MEMTTYYGVTRSNYYLEHHGVKGQRWGVRRYQNKDGSLTAAGKRHIQNAVNATADMVKRHIPSPEKREAAAKARQARKEQKAAEKRQKELDSYKTDPRKRLKNMDKLTNAELKALKERLELENKVSDLTREQLEKPKKMADMVLGYAQTGIDIADKVVKGYDMVQNIKAMANGTRANGKNLVGEELTKFLDAKDKLAGKSSSSDSNSDTDSNTGGGKKKGKGENQNGGNADSKGESSAGKKADDGDSNAQPEAKAKPDKGPGDFLDRMAEKVDSKARERDEARAAKDEYQKKQGGDVSGDWRNATKIDNNPYMSRKVTADRHQYNESIGPDLPPGFKRTTAPVNTHQYDKPIGPEPPAKANRDSGKTVTETKPVQNAMKQPASSGDARQAAASGKAIADRLANTFSEIDSLTGDMLANNANTLASNRPRG